MLRTLLVPLDGSPFGEQALPLALSLARRAGAALRIVHVHVPQVYVEGMALLADTLEQRSREQENQYLARVAQRIAAVSTVATTTALLEGTIADALREHVTTANIDLVVMTTHGRGPLSRFWLGSVADDLVRQLSVPLLLVRPTDAAPELSQDVAPRHLLIPLDGSSTAEHILEPARQLAQLMQARCTLLRVVPLLASPDDAGPISFAAGGASQAVLAQVQQMQQQQQTEAQAYLDHIAERLRGQALSVQTRVIVERHVAAAILDLAHDLGADLIALETRGQRGLSRLLSGSVADKVIRSASCPVLVQAPHGS